MELEDQSSLIVFHLTIPRLNSSLDFNICMYSYTYYEKPEMTDTVIAIV